MVMRMSIRVAVVGATGYAGGEVLRYLTDHPEVEIGELSGHSSAGDRLGEHHRRLYALREREITPLDPARLARHDVVFLGLPHGTSAAVTAQIEAAAADAGSDPLLIDLGADHRLERDADWDAFYRGGATGSTALSGEPRAQAWTYGMPELYRADGVPQRERLSFTRRIAVPGCNATAVTLAAQPAIIGRIGDPAHIVAALTVGYSGAGKSTKLIHTAAQAAENVQCYSFAGRHRHIPEIEQNLRAAGAGQAPGRISEDSDGEHFADSQPKVALNPVLAPFARGIFATVTIPALPGVSEGDVRQVYAQQCEGETFIRLLDAGQWPTTAEVANTPFAHLGVGFDAHTGLITVACAIDNLGKGTAGAAVQSMNLALGLPEGAGLISEVTHD